MEGLIYIFRAYKDPTAPEYFALKIRDLRPLLEVCFRQPGGYLNTIYSLN